MTVGKTAGGGKVGGGGIRGGDFSFSDFDEAMVSLSSLAPPVKHTFPITCSWDDSL